MIGNLPHFFIPQAKISHKKQFLSKFVLIFKSLFNRNYNNR